MTASSPLTDDVAAIATIGPKLESLMAAFSEQTSLLNQTNVGSELICCFVKIQSPIVHECIPPSQLSCLGSSVGKHLPRTQNVVPPVGSSFSLK